MIGEVVAGRFRIVDKIGSGGAGEVFEAEDLELPRKVAIKLLAPNWGDDRSLRQRFIREAEALSALDHPNICTIYESGETEDGRLFIAMAYYAGQNLRAVLAQGAMPIEEAVSCAVSIADGMEKAHRMGFLHRDLKPGNIVLTEDGVVKILDFGLAKLPDRTQMTETGVAMGTLAYAPPEQVRGDKLTAAADIYALGVILYQMVTGVCPFAASNAPATLKMVLEHDPPDTITLNDNHPPELSSLIRSCMSKDPDARPVSMTELRDRLVDVLTEIAPGSAARHRAGFVEPDTLIRRRSRRRKRVIIPAIVAILLAIGFWQREAITDWLNPAANTSNDGIVVMPLHMEGSGDDIEALAAGLTIELRDQATRLVDHTRSLWVLPRPPYRHATQEDAGKRYGARYLITGFVASDDGAPAVELQLKDSSTLTVLEEGSWSLHGGTGGVPDFATWLSRSLDVDAELSAVHADPPDDGIAWRSYVNGLAIIDADAEGALTEFDAALTRAPDFASARIGKADALIRLERLDEAEALLQSEPRHPALLGQNYALLSDIASRRGDPAEATRLMRSAVLRSPNDPVFRRKLAAALGAEGADELVEQAYLEAIDLNPGYCGAREQLGYYYYISERLAEAAERYREVTECSPGYANGFLMVGACNYGLERWDEATEMFEKSFAIRKSYPACSNLGLLYYMDRDFARAAGMFELADEYYPDNHVITGNLAASVRWVPEREHEAAELFAEATRLAEADLAEAPDDAGVLAYLSGYLVNLDPERAVDLANRAVELAPDDSVVQYRAAVTHAEAGNDTRAIKLLGEAIALGYQTREILNEPLLDDLREDPRFRLLLP